jgi:CHASE2 domain-containing sensor protein
MTIHAILQHKKLKPVLGGAFVALLAWQLCPFRLGVWLDELSYDIPFLFTAPSAPSNVVLVEMDETSHNDLKQYYGVGWDRRLHTRLLDHLRADGSDVVVFDVVFPDLDRDASVDAELAAAIRNHGRVVLGAEVSETRRGGIVGASVIPPNEILRDATRHWGPTQAERGSDGVIRKLYPGTETKPAMAWVAATLVADTALNTNSNHFAERWIRYYGPGGTLARVSYSHATNQPPGFFRGKTVFIGGGPKTRYIAEEADEFLTPWRRRTQPQISGPELTATQFINLRRGEFLLKLSGFTEFWLLILLGVLAGGGLVLLRPVRAVIVAAAGVISVLVLAFVLFSQMNHWFNWTVVALVQIPAALAWSLGWQWSQMKKEKEFLESPMADLWDDMPADKPATASTLSPSVIGETAPTIPDHTMLRQVGRGAYGDVWLARDVLGNFHAVKIVRRVAFDHAGPYDREFRGLQRFTPISRAHPGLVHILHVGRNITEDFFYYVMEAGDDEKSGATIDPATYSPRNLGRDLHRRAPLPPGECVEIISALCDALEYLHGRGLIHRDIKPANIIFVNGRPKLADIGLVTEINESQHRASLVGTDGYLPPEGPGTTAGDLFALGKVLEEMLVRGTDSPHPPDEARARLESIIKKACAENPAERFAGAREMREAVMRANEI